MNTPNNQHTWGGALGGAFNIPCEEASTPSRKDVELMLALAVSASKSLGINLKPSLPTGSVENCMFEACILQVSDELMEEERDPQYWRERVVNFVRFSSLAYSRYYRKKLGRVGTKQEQWNRDWDFLLQSGNYNCRAGDLLPPDLAACMK